MELTNTDKMFLEAVIRAHKGRRDGHEPFALRTPRLLLSDGLLELFEVEKNAPGFWCFDVYVELEPLVKEQPAADWQDVDKLREAER